MQNLTEVSFWGTLSLSLCIIFQKWLQGRFLFPLMSTPSTYIHEDRGDNNMNETLWFCLNGYFNSVYSFMVIPKRLMAFLFINAHNKPISKVFNFNTNIRIGDTSQVFYSTLYTSKSTQDVNSEKTAVYWACSHKKIKRLLVNSVYPFMVISKRLMGCLFINAHNKPISEVFNFNTNIWIGDALQVFYSTLYTGKSTQDVDNEKQLRIGCAVIKK